MQDSYLGLLRGWHPFGTRHLPTCNLQKGGKDIDHKYRKCLGTVSEAHRPDTIACLARSKLEDAKQAGTLQRLRPAGKQKRVELVSALTR